MIAGGRLPGRRSRRTGRPGEAGTSLAEILAVLGVITVIGTTALPAIHAQLDAMQAPGAARYLAALVSLTRAEALKRGVYVGLVFRQAGQGFRFAMFADGNRDGLRTGDITTGVDRQVTAWDRLSDHFPRAVFGIAAGVTDPESGSPLSGTPLKLGGANLLSFAPDGAATSGTVYVRGPAGQQYAIRLLGATGRSRVLRFDFRVKKWVSA